MLPSGWRTSSRRAITAEGLIGKLPVQAWVRQAGETIERITGLKVGELDFTDDRLTLLLRRLSKPATWQAIETELGRNILRVYELQPERVRLDPTTVSGYHAGGEDSLFQFGHSKDDPTLRQVKVMVAAEGLLGAGPAGAAIGEPGGCGRYGRRPAVHSGRRPGASDHRWDWAAVRW